MSAYVVAREHVDVLLAYGLGNIQTVRWRHFPGPAALARPELSALTVDAVGQLLVDENILSVTHRYPNIVVAMLGPADAYWTSPYRYRAPGFVPSSAEVLKALEGYEYQACEHPGWETSEAQAVCAALAARAVRDVPGYTEAPWEWNAERVAERRAASSSAQPVARGGDAGLDLHSITKVEPAEPPTRRQRSRPSRRPPTPS